MRSINIFISYRRDHDGARSALVEKAIQGSFELVDADSTVSVYRDVSDRIGVEWPQRIESRLAEADIAVVIIGPEWLGAVDKYCRRRIDQEDDWVRREIAISLERGISVIPLLFDDAGMPPADALPEVIAQLADRQGLNIRIAYFDQDVQPLLFEISRQAQGKGQGQGGKAALASTHDGNEWPYPNPPLPVRPAQMSDLDIATAIEQLLDGWEVVESPLPEDPSKRRVELFHPFEFPSFGVALDFMNEAADFCERANHHPRWENIYKTVRIYLTSWDIGFRISHLDVVMAAHFDRLATKYVAR